MDLPLPIQVIYAGLGGSLLALIVATIQQQWQMRVFFILALRLAIGWHFLFEGMNKIRSYYTGPTLYSKPFSSEAYFREAEGPIAGWMQQQFLEDPEAKLNNYVIPAGSPTTVGELLGSAAEGVLKNEFSESQAVRNHIRIYTPAAPVASEADVFATKMILAFPLAGRGVEFLADYPKNTAGRKLIDEQILAAIPAGARERFEWFKKEIVEKAEPEKQQKALALLEQARRDYAEWCVGLIATEMNKKYVSMDIKQSVPARLVDYNNRKAELAALIARRNADVGRSSLFEDIAAARADVKAVRNALTKDAEERLDNTQTDLLKVTGVAQPKLPDPPPSKIAAIDFQTMWMLTICGALLIIGLGTRIAAFICAGFLVLTYLTYPPFPWLPNPPGTEGNPIFVNKNTIEALGLLVVAVHPTGRWLGIDGLIHYLLNKNKS